MSHNGEVIGIDDDDDDNVSGDDQQILFIGDEEHKFPRRRHPTSGQQQPLSGLKSQRAQNNPVRSPKRPRANQKQKSCATEKALLSPSPGKKSKFFDSQNSSKNQRQGTLPFSKLHSPQPAQATRAKAEKPSREAPVNCDSESIGADFISLSPGAAEDSEENDRQNKAWSLQDRGASTREPDSRNLQHNANVNQNGKRKGDDPFEIPSEDDGISFQQPQRAASKGRNAPKQAAAKKGGRARGQAAGRGRGKFKQQVLSDKSDQEFVPGGQRREQSNSRKTTIPKRLSPPDQNAKRRAESPSSIAEGGSDRQTSASEIREPSVDMPNSREPNEPAGPSGCHLLTPPTGDIGAQVTKLAQLNDSSLRDRLPDFKEFDLEEMAVWGKDERNLHIYASLMKLKNANKDKEAEGKPTFMNSLEARTKEVRAAKNAAPPNESPIQLSPGCTPQKEKANAVSEQPRLSDRPQLFASPAASDGRDSDADESRDMRIATWEPPPSSHFLIEEMLYNNPWKLLTACMLLNKTSGRAVRKIMWELFELCPTPEAGRDADVKAVEQIILPLGLQHKRALIFQRFCREYIEKEWKDPRQLHGIGQYAADAYYMFCRGKWRNRAPPEDKDLLKYHKFLVDTDGQGNGFEREQFAAEASSQCSLFSDL